MLAILACSLLLTASDPDVTQAYQEARAKATRSPEDQVRLALWAEAHGLTAERLNHLALAVLADPTNATARGLMGLVAYQGRFRSPEAVAETSRSNPALAEYDTRRMKTEYNAEAQWALGVWADEHGLKEQAKAHFTAVIRLDPTRELAWKRLGYKHQGKRWTTDAQVAAEKLEADAQKAGDKHWRPLIDRYKSMLGQPAKREEAESALALVSDPRAVPSILGAFVDGRAVDQLKAIQLLGQIDSPSASRALAALAVFPRDGEVRRMAIETLRWRDPRDFVRLWLGLVRDPIKYQVTKVGGPGSPGSLTIEGPKSNLKRVYAPPGMPDLPRVQGARITTDANGLEVVNEMVGRVGVPIVKIPTYTLDGSQLQSAINQAAHGGDLGTILRHQSATGHPVARATGTNDYFLTQNGPVATTTLTRGGRTEEERILQIPIGQMRLEALKSAAEAQRQLAGDVQVLEQTNAQTRRANEPVLLALRTITGKDFGDDATTWNRWWTDQQGYAFAITQTADTPTIVETVPLAYTPMSAPQIVAGAVIQVHHSCFGAGTMVRTQNGDQAIESIRAGDLVLTQDPKLGGLTYQAVLTAFHNPPSPTLRVKLGEETVVVTGIHRFWKAGKGWTMARDLKVGDPVRTLGGVARVESVEDDRVQPVFNLEVAEGHSFLVGRLGALVHDNSLVEPVLNPFDASTPR